MSDGDVLGRVIEPKPDAGLPPGKLIVARLGWLEYSVTRADALSVLTEEFESTLWLTALSSPSLTVYTALDLFGRCMPGIAWW